MLCFVNIPVHVVLDLNTSWFTCRVWRPSAAVGLDANYQSSGALLSFARPGIFLIFLIIYKNTSRGFIYIFVHQNYSLFSCSGMGVLLPAKYRQNSYPHFTSLLVKF